MGKPSGESMIGAYEAKTRLPQLLERVEAGEEIIITRHGHPVARLVPCEPQQSLRGRKETIQQIRDLASRNNLGGLKAKDLLAEGRR
ncbi:MAG: type II toxin-antitoxin system Phd/YefM family antitoxin [Gemmataceae bacterium]